MSQKLNEIRRKRAREEIASNNKKSHGLWPDPESQDEAAVALLCLSLMTPIKKLNGHKRHVTGS